MKSSVNNGVRFLDLQWRTGRSKILRFDAIIQRIRRYGEFCRCNKGINFKRIYLIYWPSMIHPKLLSLNTGSNETIRNRTRDVEDERAVEFPRAKITARNRIFQVARWCLLSAKAFKCKVLFKYRYGTRTLTQSSHFPGSPSLSLTLSLSLSPSLWTKSLASALRENWRDKRLHFLIFKCIQASFYVTSSSLTRDKLTATYGIGLPRYCRFHCHLLENANWCNSIDSDFFFKILVTLYIL